VTAATMLAEARKWLGTTGRPNALTRAYAARNGPEFADTAWCDIAVTEWARRSGNAAAVLPHGDRAYTVFHAQDGQGLGLWHTGTSAHVKAYAKPGAVIFFDWGGTDGISAIDHVGLVEVNLGDGRVQTIEANTGDACLRRVRRWDVIAGFWNPIYGATGTPAAGSSSGGSWTEDIVKDLPELKAGANNYDVKTLRAALFARGGLAEASYGGTSGLREWLERTDFDAALTSEVKAFQRSKKLDADGIVGQLTWPHLLRAS
jgi:peptidoglycan hydrolase-like protein with peptidoglycan-binding domain